MPIERLASHHNIESFTCGEKQVDDFLRLWDMENGEGTTWVVVPFAGSDQIIAFYNVDPDPIVEVVDGEYGETPVGMIALEWLGVGLAYQDQGIGTRLLIRVIKRILQTAGQHSIQYLLVTALHDRAKRWYISRNFGFREAMPDSLHLILPVAIMHQLLESGTFKN